MFINIGINTMMGWQFIAPITPLIFMKSFINSHGAYCPSCHKRYLAHLDLVLMDINTLGHYVCSVYYYRQQRSCGKVMFYTCL